MKSPSVIDNEVSKLGQLLARFESGQLSQNDQGLFYLPTGFIWTTAELRADKTTASEAYQTTEQWNTVTYDSEYVRYGTHNYILVPRWHSGKDNGLFIRKHPHPANHQARRQ